MKIYRYIQVLLVFLFIAGCSSPTKITDPTPTPNPKVVISPAMKSLTTVGETYEVVISVEDVSNVFGYNIYLLFDPSLVEMVSSSAGNFLGGSTTGLYAVYKDTDQGSGILIVVDSRNDAKTSSGDGELCRITFRALTSGTSSLEFYDVNSTSVLEDLSGNMVQVNEWVDAS